MKQLILVRHAKSSWSDPGMRDFDRPLNERGERNAPEMGARLRAAGRVPQMIIASGARRAWSTARLMAAELDYPVADIEVIDALYEAPVNIWLGLIRGLPAHLDRVMMVGHNPGITELVNKLCPDARIENMPTCGVFCFEHGGADWGGVGSRRAHAWDFDYPKRVLS